MPPRRDAGSGHLQGENKRSSLGGFCSCARFGINAPLPTFDGNSRMHKLRQVRLSYPDAFVEFAVALALDVDKRLVAAALSIPVSTMFRWLVDRRNEPTVFARGWTTQRSEEQRARIDALVAACAREGFDVRA